MAKIWTVEEVDYLYDNVGRLKINTMARHLGRTDVSIEIKLKKLNISNTREQTGLYALGELAKILKVDRNTVLNWAMNHDLPYKKRTTRYKKVFKLIDIVDFWGWAKKHSDRIDFSRIDKNSLPPEPEWVDALRHQKRVIKGNQYKGWTVKEEQKLREYVHSGKPYDDISKEMNRTVISLKRKYVRLLEQASKESNQII